MSFDYTTSSTASHQHQQEQEMLSSFAVPKPPVSTQQSSAAAESDTIASNDAPRTLWMGDLDPWLDEAAIADLWYQLLGKKVTIKIIKPKNVRGSMSSSGLSHSGYCFVEFESYEDAQQALSLNGQLLPDIAMPSQQLFPNNPDNQKKYFRLNWASGATLTAPIVQGPEYSLFVGDLSASTTEAHLLAFFQKSFPNSIKTVRVMTDPVTGKLRCFGFVRFTDESERQRALVEMNGAWFGGRPLRVALATPRSSGKRFGFQNMYPFWGGGAPYYPYGYAGAPGLPDYGNMGGLNEEDDYGGAPPPPPPPPPPGQIPYPPPVQQYTDPNNTTVFVGGLSSDVNEQTLFTLFKQFGIIQQIKIPPGKNCGFVKYTNREDAEEAIASMQGFIIGGNRVRLSWGRVLASNKKFQQQQHQVAQAAQMEAAAALSMGMDPSSAIAAAAAAAAAGYPMGQMPMGMMNYHPGMRGIQGHPVGGEGSQLPAQLMEGQGQYAGQPPPFAEQLQYDERLGNLPGQILGQIPGQVPGQVPGQMPGLYLPSQIIPPPGAAPPGQVCAMGSIHSNGNEFSAPETGVENLTSTIAQMSVGEGTMKKTIIPPGIQPDLAVLASEEGTTVTTNGIEHAKQEKSGEKIGEKVKEKESNEDKAEQKGTGKELGDGKAGERVTGGEKVRGSASTVDENEPKKN